MVYLLPENMFLGVFFLPFIHNIRVQLLVENMISDCYQYHCLSRDRKRDDDFFYVSNITLM